MHNALNAIGIAWYPHHVEHLAPLCATLQAPILALNGVTASVASICYPNLQVRVQTQPQPILQQLLYDRAVRSELQSYDVILYSHLFTRQELREAFGSLKSPPPRVVHCPHGFSEKKQIWSAAAAYQDINLIYGDFSLRQLDSWGVRHEIKDAIIVGDYRYEYFCHHRHFFDELLTHRGIVRGRGRNVLYAPTWQDSIRSSSYKHAFRSLVDLLMPGDRLFVKPHPLLEPNVTGMWRKLLSTRKDILLLEALPLTYPILDLVDVYVGDMSALAYDFLRFLKPMVFLNQTADDLGDASSSRLFECGTVLSPREYGNVYRAVNAEIDRSPHRTEIKSNLHREVYSVGNDLASISRELIDTVRSPPSGWLLSF